MAGVQTEWIDRFLAWLAEEKKLKYGNDEELYILAESFYTEHADCPLTFTQLVYGYWGLRGW